MSFTPDETDYLRSQPLARLATVSADGQPDVVPVAFELDGSRIWIGGSGVTVLATRKFRNIAGGNRAVALVVDDLVSFDPFIARGIRIYGRASDPVERTGSIGPGTYMGITPITSWTWNMEGQPVGETWYPSQRREHIDDRDDEVEEHAQGRNDR
jgi:pyridoxamine 5'-phosphate oxidase family protein